MTGTITDLGHGEYALYIFALLVVFTFLLVIALRLSMAFSSLTIGKSLDFTTSWRITRKNTFCMLAATLGGGIPLLAVEALLLWAADHYFQIDLLAGTAPDPDMIYIFVLVSAPVLTLPMAILCSLTSSFYRHCGCADLMESSE
ncbi:MAG: hypothetical protein GXP02_05810 [Alphaproteobacteria bacterium]|nr:hypothetical protein [Alphaproteobacteria bacterium]